MSKSKTTYINITKKYFRICERKNDKLYSLFHSVNKTRHMPINTWLFAKIKPVYDGSRKTAKEYISGFHVFDDKNICKSFIKMFRKQRELVMVECEVGNIWLKSHSRSKVLLTDKIKLNQIVEILKK